MIYIKCSKCSNVHNIVLSDSFSTCGCGGQMKLIRIADEQHQKAVSALQEYLDALVTSSLERVQELTKGEKMHDEYESWSANWLSKNGDARSWEGIESVCVFMRWYRDATEVDEIFEAADWAVSTADAAERAISWFKEGRVYDMLWWLDNAVFNAEAVKGLAMENCRTRKAEVLALLKENGYEVGTLQTVIECPTCGKTGEETMFTECCCKYVLGLLGIHSIQRNSECPLCGLALRSDEDETGCFQGYCSTNAIHTDLKRRFLKDKNGYCYAYEDDTQESCKYYLPYRAAFTNGANWECQHHRLDGRCAA